MLGQASASRVPVPSYSFRYALIDYLIRLFYSNEFLDILFVLGVKEQILIIGKCAPKIYFLCLI